MANRLPHAAAPAHPPTRDSSMAGWAFSWRWRALANSVNFAVRAGLRLIVFIHTLQPFVRIRREPCKSFDAGGDRERPVAFRLKPAFSSGEHPAIRTARPFEQQKSSKVRIRRRREPAA